MHWPQPPVECGVPQFMDCLVGLVMDVPIVPIAVACVVLALAVFWLRSSRDQPKEDTFESHVLPHGPLKELAPGLWQVTGSLSYPMPRNMVVYRMGSGGLLLHSVIALGEEEMEELRRLGEPEVIIIPSAYHRLDAAVYKRRFPDVTVLCPAAVRGAAEKAVHVDGTCEEYFPRDGVECAAPGGFKPSELVFELDIAQWEKKALVFCDTLFNLGPGDAGVVSRLLGSVGDGTSPIVTRISRWFGIADKAAARGFFEGLSERSDIAVVCVAHGNAVLGPTISAALRAASESV